MATYTPNYNLGKPDVTDPFGYNSFLPLFNDNMDKIDQIGGSSTYTAGDGIDITNGTISLAYLKVVNGTICVEYDDGE
jgi:hypothetical protein